jgi:TrmH family RNA methyltransferase
MPEKNNTGDNTTIILHRPAVPDNIGAVARIMSNTGFTRLVISQPETDDWRKAEVVAVSAAGLLENAPRTDSLAEAISMSGAHFVVGTTGRDRKYWNARNIDESAKDILVRAAVTPTAIIFGPENFGLSNDELALCHLHVTIPAVDLASYNLSHAAAIVLFSIMTAAQPAKPEAPGNLAPFEEMEGMYDHIRQALSSIGFLLEENPEHMMKAIRSFMNKAEPTVDEVTIVRGVCRRLMNHLRNSGGGDEPID